MRTLIFLLGFSLICEARNKTEERPHRRRHRKKKNGDDHEMDSYMADGIHDDHENFGVELDGEVFVGNEYHSKHAAHKVDHHQNYEGLSHNWAFQEILICLSQSYHQDFFLHKVI